MKRTLLRSIIIILFGVIALAATLVLIVRFWPHTTPALQSGTPKTISYEQATTQVNAVHSRESERGVTEDCGSKLLTHGNKSAKTVVMFHGITDCPKQFTPLGEHFFAAGYNVYIPRAPYHGTADKKAHSQVLASNLVDYINESITIATGLGDEVGVIGLSGGAAVGTWAAEYRPEVRHLLALSPFYEPDASQAPKWQLPFLKTLYGYHIMPDAYSGNPDGPDIGFSFRALANYMILTANLKSDPSDLPLQSIAVVTSLDDTVIDHTLATSIPQAIADANQLPLRHVTLPADWQAGHAIVSLDTPGVAAHKDALFALYLELYEGRDAQL